MVISWLSGTTSFKAAVQATTAYLAFVLNDVVSNSSMQWWDGFVNKWFPRFQINLQYNDRQESTRLWTMFLPELDKLDQNKNKLEKLYCTKHVNARLLSPRYSGSYPLIYKYNGPPQFKNDWSKIMKNVDTLLNLKNQKKLNIRDKKYQGHLDGSSYGLAKPVKVRDCVRYIKSLNEGLLKIMRSGKDDRQLGTTFSKVTQISSALIKELAKPPYQQQHSFTSTLF